MSKITEPTNFIVNNEYEAAIIMKSLYFYRQDLEEKFEKYKNNMSDDLLLDFKRQIEATNELHERIKNL